MSLSSKHAHAFDEATGHMYEVTLKTVVEVAFDSTPSEKELRVALLDNALDHLTWLLDHEQETVITRDLSYAWIDKVPTL